MPLRTFSLAEALANRRSNKLHRWGKGEPDRQLDDPDLASNRIGKPYLATVGHPSTKVRPGSVYAVGSCFAREIEGALQSSGWTVLSLADALTDEIFHAEGRPEYGFINRYSAPAMALEFERGFGVITLGETELMNEVGDNLFFDPNFTNSLAPAPLEVCTRRRKLTAEVVRTVADADVVVLTLGLNEAWYDLEAGRYLNVMPRWNPREGSTRYEVHTLTVRENVEALERIYRLLKARAKRDLQLVITVSPVSLQTTFMPEDIVVANAEAKATLRAAAAEFCHAHADVSYFQSYEIVMNSELDSAFHPDRQHVRRKMVRHIVSIFTRDFVSSDKRSEGDPEGARVTEASAAKIGAA